MFIPNLFGSWENERKGGGGNVDNRFVIIYDGLRSVKVPIKMCLLAEDVTYTSLWLLFLF